MRRKKRLCRVDVNGRRVRAAWWERLALAIGVAL